jgi:predicted amidohydrolase YtcJ
MPIISDRPQDVVEEVDMGGSVILPGLIDAHTHLIMFGSSLSRVDCLGKSVEEIQNALKTARSANPHARMILARSFLFDALGQRPHQALLDAVVPDIPVFIDSADLHSCWANSAGLKAVGVDESTENPKGGEFVRDEQRRLTGLCLETAATEYIWAYIARQTTLEERLAHLDRVFDEYVATGVTGVVDMAMTPEDLEALEMYYARNKRLPIRVAAQWIIRPEGTNESRAGQIQEAAAHRGRLAALAPWLQVTGIKIISDGVVDSCTAFLTKPYADGSLPGPIWPKDELNKVIVLADSLDLQVAVHAIGDATSEQALNAFEAAVEANGPRSSRRHRIEHLEVVSKESIARLTRLGVIASLQPVHADPVYVPNWRLMLGEDERCDRAFPWTEYVDAGSHVAFGSDAPTAPHHCLPNLYTAITRRSAINPKLPPPIDPRLIQLERFNLKLDTAIRFYTAGSAYSTRSEARYGTLEPGKAADFCVLSIDPFADGVETLREAQQAVTQTWIRGERVWMRQE